MSSRPFILRLILPFAVMILIVVGVCGAVIYWTGQRNVRMQQIHDLDRLVGLVRERLAGDVVSLSPVEERQLRDLANVLEARITLIDGKGVVFFDNYHDPQDMENHNGRPEVIDARQSGAGRSVRRSDTIQEDAVYVAQLLDSSKPDGIVVRLSYPQRVWVQLGVPVWAIIAASTISAALLMFLLARILQRQWIQPVRDLADAADRIAAGNWAARVDPAGDDSVRFLGNRFNVMAAQTEKSVADLHHQRADLQALVDSLPDPILLSDGAGRIVVINSPAAKLLQLKPDQALGKKLDFVVNEEQILRVIDGVEDSESPVIREIRLQRSGQRVTYQAVATASKAGGILLVLRNVSAMAAAVQMKTDFVANASHELRTPIAAIKAAFETLEEVYSEDPDQTARCVTIIGGHLKRLEEMLSDLLDLSRVESADLKAQMSPVKISDLVSFLRSTMGPAARAKQVELEFVFDELSGETEFHSDRHLLELILKNLVENSIKFTPASGSVTVTFSNRAGATILEVTDTGIGIPPEHLERVFERFYQVDPARSGSAGRGTGLGLAIVKHAIHALSGTVHLTSAVGEGTKARCILPEIPVAQEITSPNDSISAAVTVGLRETNSQG